VKPGVVLQIMLTMDIQSSMSVACSCILQASKESDNGPRGSYFLLIGALDASRHSLDTDVVPFH
jgi:hypothetical protein